MTRILFIQIGRGFEHPNKHLIAQIYKNFGECEVEVYDLLKVIKKDYWFLLCNLVYMIRENLIDQLLGRKNLLKYRLHFLGTTYIFKKFSELAVSKLAQGHYDFIFQTQSLCDSKNDKGVPFYIYTDHTNLNNLNYKMIKSSQFLRSGKYTQLERKAYENANLIFVMSDNIKESLISQYHIDAEKIKLVYVSVNTPVTEKLNTNKYKSKNILFVGKDWVRKGGPLLAEAFRLVQRHVPDARLTVVGCKPNIKLENVFVYGELSLDKVGELYNDAAVFCMPTLREPFGIVFLEAMFNRLPIVTNSVGATPFLVKQGFNGYLLNHNAEEYAKTLSALIRDAEKCEQFGANSFEIASRTYTWNNVGKLIKQYVHESIFQLF